MKKKFILFTTVLTMLVFYFIWGDLIFYLYRQARGQLRVMREMRPIEEILTSPNYPDSVKEKIYFIREIKNFGETELGFPATENYSHYFEQNGKPILHLITASNEFALEEYFWSFPFLGEVSYKGFFDEDLLLKEKEKLAEKGLVTDVREAAAWSTLGILPDPILSGMTERNEFRLADLIFHENTHTIYYAPDSTEYNENLADYVAMRCTEFYLEKKYPDNPQKLKEYRLYLRDRSTLRNFLKRKTDSLQIFYEKMPQNWDLSQKRLAKKAEIEKIMRDLWLEKFNNPDFYDYFDKKMPDNAFFTGYLQYSGLQGHFDSLFREKTPQEIIQFLKEKK